MRASFGYDSNYDKISSTRECLICGSHSRTGYNPVVDFQACLCKPPNSLYHEKCFRNAIRSFLKKGRTSCPFCKKEFLFKMEYAKGAYQKELREASLEMLAIGFMYALSMLFYWYIPVADYKTFAIIYECNGLFIPICIMTYFILDEAARSFSYPDNTSKWLACTLLGSFICITIWCAYRYSGYSIVVTLWILLNLLYTTLYIPGFALCFVLATVNVCEAIEKIGKARNQYAFNLWICKRDILGTKLVNLGVYSMIRDTVYHNKGRSCFIRYLEQAGSC